MFVSLIVVTAWPLRQQSIAHRTQLEAYAQAFVKKIA
jgi:hypothetical protein